MTLDPFILAWKALAPEDMPEPVSEHRFHPIRRWRFDWAWPELKVGVEYEGGTWSRGRHVRGKGFAKDCEKYNEAAAMRWQVFRFTADMLRDKAEDCVDMVVVAVALAEAREGEDEPF